MPYEDVFVYIDGFNLYYGAVRNTPYKWLNLHALCGCLLDPGYTVRAIKYYTARISARPHDPDAPVRQQVYLRALKTIPNLSIHFGHFLSHPVRMPLAASIATGNVQYVEVLKTEEKGSDVNLAAHLLRDAYTNRFTLAVVVSNDSDLAEPIRIVITSGNWARAVSQTANMVELSSSSAPRPTPVRMRCSSLRCT